MNLSNYLSQLWGIAIMAVSFIILVNPKLLESFIVKAKNKATMSFWGITTLIIGIAMVLVHNFWVLNWRVVITILGWLTLLKGLDLLFFPKRMHKRWLEMKNGLWMWIFGFLFIAGLVLTYLGFTQ